MLVIYGGNGGSTKIRSNFVFCSLPLAHREICARASSSSDLDELAHEIAWFVTVSEVEAGATVLVRRAGR
jgi:hypothetical protein